MALNSTRPSIDSQRPSRVCTLFATATWVCRSGSPARESRWVNAAATRPVTLTCRIPCCPVRVNRASRSMKLSASRTAAWCASSICAATVRVGDRPQGRHRLHRGEGQVIAGNRLGARTGLLSDCRRKLAGIDRLPAMLASEELPGHLGAHLRPMPQRHDRPPAARPPSVAWRSASPPRRGTG